MTPAGFRRLALGFDGAVEQAHQGHPDFRAHGRIFATLGYPDKKHAMIVLAPDQQQRCVADSPTVFIPVKGKWGEKGCTLVHLPSADAETAGEALTLAWQGTRARTDKRKLRTDDRQPRTGKR